MSKLIKQTLFFLIFTKGANISRVNCITGDKVVSRIHQCKNYVWEME